MNQRRRSAVNASAAIASSPATSRRGSYNLNRVDKERMIALGFTPCDGGYECPEGEHCGACLEAGIPCLVRTLKVPPNGNHYERLTCLGCYGAHVCDCLGRRYYPEIPLRRHHRQQGKVHHRLQRAANANANANANAVAPLPSASSTPPVAATNGTHLSTLINTTTPPSGRPPKSGLAAFIAQARIASQAFSPIPWNHREAAAPLSSPRLPAEPELEPPGPEAPPRTNDAPGHETLDTPKRGLGDDSPSGRKRRKRDSLEVAAPAATSASRTRANGTASAGHASSNHPDGSHAPAHSIPYPAAESSQPLPATATPPLSSASLSNIQNLNATVTRETVRVQILRDTLRSMVAQIVEAEQGGLQASRQLKSALGDLPPAERAVFEITLENFSKLWQVSEGGEGEEEMTDEGRQWLAGAGLR